MCDTENRTNQPQTFTVSLRAAFSSTLSPAELERRIVLALFDQDSGVTTPDGKSDEFEILDYEFSTVSELAEVRQEKRRQ